MNVLIILGNGFSIDFIDHIEKSEIIDVKNLFHLGEKVPWPRMIALVIYLLNIVPIYGILVLVHIWMLIAVLS